MGPAAVRAEEADGGLLGVGPRLPLVEYRGWAGGTRQAAQAARWPSIQPLSITSACCCRRERAMMVSKRVVMSARSSSPTRAALAASTCFSRRHVQHRQAMGGLIFPYLPGYRQRWQNQLGDLPVDLVNLGAQALQIFHYRYNSLSLT